MVEKMDKIIEAWLNPIEYTLEEKMEFGRKKIEGTIYDMLNNKRIDIEGVKKVLASFDDEWLIKEQERILKENISLSRYLARNLTRDRISIKFIQDACHVDRSIFEDYIDIGGEGESED